MLGYVKIDKAELKVREYEIYTGYYCGVCKSIGSRYGQLPRMFLSYDAAFLAMLLASLSDESDAPVQEHCVAHPVVKKKTIIRNRAVDYAADVMLILAWYKIADDANDEGKLYAKPVMLLMQGIFRRLTETYPELCSSIKEHLSALSALENEKCASMDMAAEAFSKIMEDIFTEGFKAVYEHGSREPDKLNSQSANPENQDASDTGPAWIVPDISEDTFAGRLDRMFSDETIISDEDAATSDRDTIASDMAAPVSDEDAPASDEVAIDSDEDTPFFDDAETAHDSDPESDFAAGPNPEPDIESCASSGTDERSGNSDISTADSEKNSSDICELLAAAGYHLGKWVYMIDAVDDIEENIESGAYNPLLYRFEFDADSETADEFRRRIEPNLRFNLYHYLAMLSRCTDSLDIKKNAGILENVIYFGLNRKTEEIITRVDKDKQL